ncbi:F-box protein At4g02760-like [Carex rostrata]
MANLNLPKRRCLAPPFDTTAATATTSLDRFLESALAMEDFSIPIGLSLERILDSTPLQSDKESILDGATRLASALMDVSTRSMRKLATAHNLSVWPLTADLTIKVFSMLDTESVCFAAATCSLFSRCASDSLCYANIDLTRSVAKVTNPIVSTMIQRAGKNLQSIKLGRLPQDNSRFDKSPLTGSCLAALVSDGGAAGLLLQKLHLHNLKMKDYNPCLALSACKNLYELEIIGMDGWLELILTVISQNCHSIERLCLEAFGECLYHVEGLTKSCPLLSSLSLRGFGIGDDILSNLIKGAQGLKYLDLSGSIIFSGSFLRDFGKGGGANSLESLILRDCINLRAREVSLFLSAVLYGDWKQLRYVDISNRKGLVVPRGSSGPRTRCAIEVSQVLQRRPDIRLIADYPPEICFYGDCTNSPSPSSDTDSSSSSCDTLSCSLVYSSSSSDEEDSHLMV